VAYGTPVILTARVAGGEITPTGTITVSDGRTVLRSARLNGTVKVELPGLSVGAHYLTVRYSGDATYPPQTAKLTLVVTPAPTTSTLTATPDPAPATAPVTLTARVTSSIGTPTGTVTFADGDRVLGRAALDRRGQASLTVPALAAGSHALLATFGGNSPYASSSATAALTVAGAALKITASTRTPWAGQSITLTGASSGSWPAGTQFRVVDDHRQVLRTCRTDCTVRVAHKAGTWTYVLVAVDRYGHPFRAAAPVTVTWVNPPKHH
jgi:Bacterial Ig-like domain (group 3)